MKIPQLSHRATRTGESSGGNLPHLPGDVFRQIAFHLTVREWAAGPAQACRSLYRMPLPCVILEFPTHWVHNKLVQGLKWSVQRTTSATHSLEIRFRLGFCSGPFVLISLMAALAGTSALSNLRCFSFEPEPSCPSMTLASAFTPFQRWVLTRAPRIEALQLLPCGPPLASCAATLQHVKHLEMEAHAFAMGVPQAPRLLPNLETLCLLETGQGNREIDLLGCQHLRRLAMKGRYMRPILREPNCQLGIHLHGFTDRCLSCWVEGHGILESDEDVVIRAGSCHEPSPGGGLCGDIGAVQSLKLTLPWRRGLFFYERHPLPNPRYILRWCMPVNGQPLTSLKALTITAQGPMQCCIPSALPNLEELVVFGNDIADVSFDNDSATFRSLKTLYIFGQPLMAYHSWKRDLLFVSVGLERKGLHLSFVSDEIAERTVGRGHSCIYMRPITAQDLPIEKLHDRVSELAGQCRCKACFECLRRAGCLTCC